MQRTNVRSEKRMMPTHHSNTRTEAGGRSVGNEILNSIPESEYNLIRHHLEHVLLPHHHILHEAGEKIEFAYFLGEGLASL